jgi:hypothetical protein
MTEYHTWKCRTCGNIWEAKPNDIKGKPTRPEGTWCPQCAEGRFERVVRKFFEALFGTPFLKEKDLKWLKKYKLHLDGYNKKLNIAFECQGIQHYQYHEHFHDHDRAIFSKSLWIDDYKRRCTKKEGIKLIEIGFELKNGELKKVKFDKMESFIRNECKKNGIVVPERENHIDWREFDINLPHHIEELQKIAHERNGKLISKGYFGKAIQLVWYCNKHQITWRAAPNDICGKPSNPIGSWCPKCAREKIRL